MGDRRLQKKLITVLRERMKNNGVKGCELANHLGVSSSMVSQVFCLRRNLSLDMFDKINKFLVETESQATPVYKKCNHHHKPTDRHTVVNFGDREFVANNDGIPVLKALNEIGLRTRTHHIEHESHSFVSILMDESVTFEIKTVNEIDADRTKYNGQIELLISWRAK